MTRLNQLLPTHLIEALGWTILHSLWQGAVLAILLTIVWIALRKNSSQVRYFVATTALFTLFLVSVITFLSLYWSFAPSASLPPAPPAPPSPSQVEIMLLLPSSPPQTAELNENLGLLADFQQYFQQHLPLIVGVWFLGIVVLMLRFLGGIAYLQRLKYYQNRPVAAEWQGTLRYLSAQIGVKQKVKLLESALVKVPMVIGYLKPVILMPLGTLSGLPVAQIESILAHELAHIRRHDYLVNILQSLVDIVLFFNPFAWWISECVREERENCCDDIALQTTGDVLTFAKTLANLEALRLDSPQLAASFMGSKGSLKQRIQRIIYGKSQRPTFSEGFFSALVLVICMAAISFQAKADFFHLKDNLINKVNELFSEEMEVMEELEEIEEYPLEMLNEDELAQALALLDTIRFGEDFMLITSPNGRDFQIFKGDKLLKEEDYPQFSNLFTVEDATIKFSNEALGDKGLEIKLEDKKGLQGWAFPEMTPFYFEELNFDSLLTNSKWKDNQDFSFGWTSDNMTAEEMREHAAKIRKEAEITRRNAEKLRKELETNRYKAEINRAKTLEKSLESLEHHIHALKLNELTTSPITGLRGFAFRQQDQSKELREQLVKDGYLNDTKESFKIKIKKEEVSINGKRVKEQEKYKTLIQKSFETISVKEDTEITVQALDEHLDVNIFDMTFNRFRLMENPFEDEDAVNINLNFDDDKAENTKHKALKEVLIEDGLMKKTDKKIYITVKGNEMSINGKKLDDKMKAKYEELLKRLFQFRFKMNKDWNIQITED